MGTFSAPPESISPSNKEYLTVDLIGELVIGLSNVPGIFFFSGATESQKLLGLETLEFFASCKFLASGLRKCMVL